MRVVLISTYDLGRQPFGLASPAAWLERDGHEVTCLDLAVESLDADAVVSAGLVAFHLPMHTATRLAAEVAARVRALNPAAHLCFFGLYAALNEPWLREIGAGTVLGGEFEDGLARLARRLASGARVERVEPAAVRSFERLAFLPPQRRGLPALDRYAKLRSGSEERVVGYTEASRGCVHLCRHCPIPPVYEGRLRIVPAEVVLEDVRRQVAAGARHITFGDPDFWNGIGHALPIVEQLHREFPDLSYDVTIKIEHLERHARHLPRLVGTGCAFVTSAVESVDDTILARLDKGHTRADFIAVAERCRDQGLVLHPTFVAFTPWITTAGYRDLLRVIACLGLVEHVAPIQLAIRLLVPRGSRLLELDDVRALVGGFDARSLAHPWQHPDPAVDALQADVDEIVREGLASGEARATIFERVARRAGLARGIIATGLAPRRAPVPFLTEPWYC